MNKKPKKFLSKYLQNLTAKKFFAGKAEGFYDTAYYKEWISKKSFSVNLSNFLVKESNNLNYQQLAI